MGRSTRRAASNAEWRRWGEADPFFGVASWPGRDRHGAEPWTAEGFYALGRSDWADFHRQWAKYGLIAGRCLEVGCGAGRLTAAMTNAFEEVIGLDVSEGMLAAAQQHVRAPNVRFVLSDGVSLPVEPVDAVLSTHVFQHLESLDLAAANFAEIARVLRSGGTMMIHLPVYIVPPGLPGIGVVIRIRRWLSDRWAATKRRLHRPLMRGLRYDWQWLRSTLSSLGLVDVELVIFAVRSNGAYQPCVLARKP